MAREVEVAVAMAIKVLIGIVFAGWMMIWVVLPTDVYREDWSPAIKKNVNKNSCFGTLGSYILIYAFPIFFNAVLGCVYLHMVRRGRKSEAKSRRKTPMIYGHLATLKRPLLVGGPLGVVSSLELTFFVMFAALVVCYFAFSISREFSGGEEEEPWKEKLEKAGFRLGLAGNVCLAFLFFPVTRLSSLLPLIGLTSESSVRYHVWMGHVTMVLFTTHGIGYMVHWATSNEISKMIKWASNDVSNVAGELALLIGLAMWATTFPSFRRKAFEVFFYTHQLYVLFLLFFVFHAGMGDFFWTLPGVYLFLLDRYLRFLQSRSSIRLLSARVLPSSLELTFAKTPGFEYNAMSIIFLNVPSVSKLQWHPFTVSSSSGLEPDILSIVIKKQGRWSTKLHDMLSSNSSSGRLLASVEGPYEPSSNRFLNYDSLVLVSGGSGITPFIGIVRELLHVAGTTSIPTPKVHLICAFKTSADLAMLDLLLPATCKHISDLSRLHLRIDAFVTREQLPPPDAAGATKQHRTIWFKPSASDSPISPVLGPNGWLWLAAVISGSFTTFLVLLGVITAHYYDKIRKGPVSPTGQPGISSQESGLTLLLMCASFMLVGGLAVLWNKPPALGEHQVQNSTTPTASSGVSKASNTDTELESLPSQSLSQATTVQYGARPDIIKKILTDCNGKETIGVFVSGPPAMRREVALICGSGPVHNIRFESVSFRW